MAREHNEGGGRVLYMSYNVSVQKQGLARARAGTGVIDSRTLHSIALAIEKERLAERNHNALLLQKNQGPMPVWHPGYISKVIHDLAIQAKEKQVALCSFIDAEAPQFKPYPSITDIKSFEHCTWEHVAKYCVKSEVWPSMPRRDDALLLFPVQLVLCLSCVALETSWHWFSDLMVVFR